MNTKNIPAETMRRIEGLEKKKADELEAIAKQIRESEKKLAAAKEELKSATERVDLTAYQAAKHKEADATAAVEMYSARYKQLQQREFVTEKQSDAAIDSLLAYEETVSAEFISAIAEPIEQLRELYADYAGSVKEAEDTLSAWTSQIHSNYRSPGTVYADGSNRSAVPVPVHRLPYSGCAESIIIGSFLDKISEKIKSE